ncbi:hypothetical protein [Archangium lipolyticum]|uniref:hypothetical protein n=1 Tax=Archangium lipolyticum TaxID=2970465 RepID=UPI00214A3D8C|nr:hypothetical protein [Archangium lipolyticum]
MTNSRVPRYHLSNGGARSVAFCNGRGCRHHENVDGLALGAERQPLVHTEAVLPVDHGDAEIVEGDFLLLRPPRPSP